MTETTGKPRCKVVGTDGNAFAIIATVTRALKGAGLHDAASEFQRRAFASESYDALLQLLFEYVDPE